MHKGVLILLFPLIAECVISCCYDCYEPEVLGEVSHCDLSVQAFNNAGTQPEFNLGDKNVPKEAFGLQLNFQMAEFSCEAPTFQPIQFIPSTYACSGGNCFYPIYIRLDSISDISITNLQDFDSNHPANSDVTDLFYGFNSFTYQSVSELIASSDLTDESFPELRYRLLLMTPPKDSAEISFRVDITLSDGRTFSDSTRIVTFIP